MNPYSHFSWPPLDHFLVWLSGTPLRLFFYGLERFDGLVVFIHVLAAATLFGAILIVDLRLMGRGSRLGLQDLARFAIPWAISGGVVTALLSGFVLLMFDPIAVGIHTYFLPKMTLIVLGLINALGFHALIKLRDSGRRPIAASLAGGVSILIWAGVFLCAAMNGTERISSARVSAASPVAEATL